MRQLRQASLILKRRGLGYFSYLLTGYLWPLLSLSLLRKVSPSRLGRVFFLSAVALSGALVGMYAGWIWALVAAAGSWAAVVFVQKLSRYFETRRKLAAVRRALSRLQSDPARTFTRWEAYPAPPETRKAVNAVVSASPQAEIVIGQIDNDGRVYCPFGPLPYVHSISRDEFVPRYRFPLSIVVRDGWVLVRKDFRGERERFLNECFNLLCLDGKANTPRVYAVDAQACIVYKELVQGCTVRDLLVQAGADILTVNVQADPALKKLSASERIEAVWKRGQAFFESALPSPFIEQLARQMDQIHAQGVTRLSLTFGNIMVDAADGRPWLIDLEGSRHDERFPSVLFDYERDRDREKFNRIYGCNLLTEQSARCLIHTRMASEYAPIDFGRGLATHGFWNTDSGTGRWEYLNKRSLAPLLNGKRILDLGANNGVMDLMMLREGASEVIALEYSAEYASIARLVHQIFEWRDLRSYPLTVYQRDMRAILSESFGDFDIVTAYCSLYYLEPEDMAAVVRQASCLSPVMILQAKTHARAEAAEKGRKSTPEYLESLLKNNGFPVVKVISPAGFTRPLLIGQKSSV